MPVPRTAARFQAQIEQIATAHSLDLSHPTAYLQLVNPPFERLVIERLSANLISVTHYPDDGAVDLRVVFATNAAAWIPISRTNWLGTQRVAWLDDAEVRLTRFLPAAQADLAQFCNGVWVKNLKWQDYSKAAVEEIRTSAAEVEPTATPAPSYTIAPGHIVSASIAAVATALEWGVDLRLLLLAHFEGRDISGCFADYAFISEGCRPDGEITSGLAPFTLPATLITLSTPSPFGPSHINSFQSG